MELNGAGLGCLAVVSIAAVVLFVVPQISDFVDEMSEETEVTTTNTASSGKSKESFKDIRLEHGVNKNGVQGMNAIVDFEVKNLQGCEGLCSLYFVYDNGADVKGRTDKNTTSDGQLAISTKINLIYKTSCFTDLTLFVPYNEFVLPVGEHKLKCYCVIWLKEGSSYKQIATSTYAKFTLTQN